MDPTTTQVPSGAHGVDDTAAVAALHAAFQAQRAALESEGEPTLEERKGHLAALAHMVVSNRDRIHEALRADFRVHSQPFADLAEVLGIAGRAQYAAQNLDQWAAPEERPVDPAMFGTAGAVIRYQPKGIVGVIAPWNFPFETSLGALADILAAGNRVIVKPSENAPASAQLIKELIEETFEPTRVTVALGGIDLAREFAATRWDHLLYTGSPAVGREVATAAARNLVPTTLELGGKNPAVVLDDAIDETTVEQIIGAKMIKSGQLCITADYCLVPRTRLDDFVTLAARHVADHFPDYAETDDCTGIISDAHLDRLTGLLDDARTAGTKVVTLGTVQAVDPSTRQMPLSLVIDPPETARVMSEEIFGPILPIVPYDSLDDAISFVNRRERPLGLYVFTHHDRIAQLVLDRTRSGGACVNTCVVQGALPALGFGGIGNSGSGRHHGIDGFREFSNPRGVVVRGENDLIKAFFPPYTGTTRTVVDAALQTGSAPQQDTAHGEPGPSRRRPRRTRR